jgi:hypothetical protein
MAASLRCTVLRKSSQACAACRYCHHPSFYYRHASGTPSLHMGPLCSGSRTTTDHQPMLRKCIESSSEYVASESRAPAELVGDGQNLGAQPFLCQVNYPLTPFGLDRKPVQCSSTCAWSTIHETRMEMVNGGMNRLRNGEQ